MAKNGKDHGNKDAIIVRKDSQVIIIINDGLPAEWASPGIHGSDSEGSGMGGFIVGQYEFLEGRAFS